MTEYKHIYKFEIMPKLLDGEVYILDKKCKTVYRASELTGAQLATITLANQMNNRYDAWIEEKAEGVK